MSNEDEDTRDYPVVAFGFKGDIPIGAISQDMLILHNEYKNMKCAQDDAVDHLASATGIPIVDEKPNVILFYKTEKGQEIPKYATPCEVIVRELVTEDPPQGVVPPDMKTLNPNRHSWRWGPNLTEMYLNRKAPTGAPIIDPRLYHLY